ncbi:MAG: enoyl-CoA hydratase/isomerase family protein [Alphaproteobacteria bacterium]
MRETILIDRDGPIATVVLNRPDVLNAVDAKMRHEIVAAMGELNADEAVRAIVLTGSGTRAFTAGQDLGELAPLDPAGGAAWVRDLGRLYQSIRDLDKPIVVAMNGLATGAGLQMALHSDVRVAHPGVRMAQPEINAGLPSVLGSWIMLISIGLSRTQELALSGKLIDAETCLRFGLVDFLVPEDLVLTDAKRIAASLAEKPPNAVRLTKRRQREVTQAGWDATVEAGARLAAEAFATGEPQATARAFLERRRERRRDFHGRA